LTTIAIDAMGGDFGLEVTVPAAILALRHHDDLNLILVGDASKIAPLLDESSKQRISVQNASEVVSMDESPASALRGKKDSSMRVAINQVKEGLADACVSAGNTGALMATARFVLKTLSNIDRPAIVSAMPRANGHVHMLDLGANVDVPAKILLQFGIMGSTLVHLLEDKARPSVGLLNMGVEDIKGNNTIREAAELFRASDLNYQGFVEGDEIFNGSVDVIVCDGFSGNVALKTSEGLAQMVSSIMREEFNRTIWTKLTGFLALPVLKSMKQRVDHRRYNGASLVGLRKTVVKSHGGADILAFSKSIEVAVREVRKNVVEHLETALSKNIEVVA
jgi:phosphate acyltransferase